MRKSIRFLILLVSIISGALFLVSCDEDEVETTPEHTHTFAESYTSNRIWHWHPAICEHKDAKKDFAEHTYGDWIVTEATVEAPGNQKRVCNVCGYEQNIEIPVLCCEYTLNGDKSSYTVTGKGTFTTTDIVIKDTYNSLPVTGIGESAFEGCTDITSVVIPNSVKIIGESAFKGCSSLKSIDIPNSVTKIGKSAFEECSGLRNATIGNGVTNIGYWAFSKCYKLVEIYNLSSVKITIGDDLDVGYYTKVLHTSLEDESHLIKKDDYLFIKDNENKYYLVDYDGTDNDLVLPNDIDGNAYEINNHAFLGYSNITSVVIPDGVTSIGDSAFKGCSSLASITIPDSVKVIGKDVFPIWNGLKYTEDNNVAYLGNEENPYVVLLGVTSIEKTTFEINSATKIIYQYAFYGCFIMDHISIPSGVTNIGDYAFSECKALSNVVIPGSVIDVGTGAFYNCKYLYNVRYLGNIGDWCKITFNDSDYSNPLCYAENLYAMNNDDEPELVQYITIPNTITRIGKCQFKDYENLRSVTISDGVTSIGYSAFRECQSLKSIFIPKSVTSIESFAFYDCKDLEVVYYNGTEEEWAKINIDSNNLALEEATIYYYSETEPTTKGNYWHYAEDGVTEVEW